MKLLAVNLKIIMQSRCIRPSSLLENWQNGKGHFPGGRWGGKVSLSILPMTSFALGGQRAILYWQDYRGTCI